MRFRIVIVLAAVLLGMTGCNMQPNDRTLPGQTAVGGDGYTVTVYFDEVANLVPNSTVQMDNVVVGTVADIDVTNWQAKVKLRLLKKVPVAKNAVFSIGQKTLLGAQFVEVSSSGHTEKPAVNGAAAGPSGADLLQDGDVIKTDQTGTYPATEQVLASVALLLNNGGLSQIHTITTELSTALQDRVPDTRGLVRRTNELLGGAGRQPGPGRRRAGVPGPAQRRAGERPREARGGHRPPRSRPARPRGGAGPAGPRGHRDRPDGRGRHAGDPCEPERHPGQPAVAAADPAEPQQGQRVAAGRAEDRPDDPVPGDDHPQGTQG